LQRMGQQELLLWIVGKIARRHLTTTFTTGNRMTARLLPRRLLASVSESEYCRASRQLQHAEHEARRIGNLTNGARPYMKVWQYLFDADVRAGRRARDQRRGIQDVEFNDRIQR
jgi:hypothetical protein